MSIPSRRSNSLDDVRTNDEKNDKTPSIKVINLKDADMGMTTTLHARDLSKANYPEFIAWMQDISQACWTVAGKNFNPAYELKENRILEVTRTLSLGHTLTVIQEVITGDEWTKNCYSARKEEARSEGTLEEFKATSKDSGREFEKEAPLSTSQQFLYKVGNGDVWRLTELVMARYLGKEVSTILEETFNLERKPGETKLSDFYYQLQQMNCGRKFLPGGERATLIPEYIVWTGMLYNHSTKTQDKLKEFNLFHEAPSGSWDRSMKLRQIETLDELSFAAYQASKKSQEQNQKRADKRSHSKNRKDDKNSNNNTKKPKVKCNYCQRLGHSEEECWKKPELRHNKNSKPKGKKETESINAMTTFEFTNQGVDRR